MSKTITLLPALAGLLFLAVFSAPTAWAQDAAAGEKKAAMCIGCHGIAGYQSSFPKVHRVPMISGQSAKYIVSSLTAYKKGDRRHPSMQAIAGSLTEKDMADLGAFYEQHGSSMIKTVADTPAVPPAGPVADLMTRGACASCHGANYSKPIDGTYPKLAGQHADYLFVSLKAYASEGNPHFGRNNAIMSAQVKQYSRAELKAMADYLGSLPGELRTVPQSKFR